MTENYAESTVELDQSEFNRLCWSLVWGLDWFYPPEDFGHQKARDKLEMGGSWRDAIKYYCQGEGYARGWLVAVDDVVEDLKSWFDVDVYSRAEHYVENTEGLAELPSRSELARYTIIKEEP